MALSPGGEASVWSTDRLSSNLSSATSQLCDFLSKFLFLSSLSFFICKVGLICIFTSLGWGEDFLAR